MMACIVGKIGGGFVVAAILALIEKDQTDE